MTNKPLITNNTSAIVEAPSPLIISASRSTDNGVIQDINKALEIYPDFQDAKIYKEKIISKLN